MRNLYPRLAATNLKKNRRFYLPYLLACIVIVALFCIMLTLASDPYLGQMQHGGSVSQVLGFGVFIMALFSAIILFYTNSTFTKQRKREVDQAKILIGNYKEQQNNVRNNREFDAITKEIEYQELEIELAEKRLKEYAAGVKAKKLQLEEAEAVAEGRAADLAAKKNELEGIEAETAPQVAEYEVQADRVKAKIDERLLSAYGRIRSNVRNGLAVVTVKRDACGGCFNRIPPQRQVEIRQGKKLIVCEYCGRILVADPEEGLE